MQSIIFRLAISWEEFQRAYSGVNVVSAIAEDGRRIRFPANILRPFLLHHGVRGVFRIEFDDNNKLAGIHKVGEI